MNKMKILKSLQKNLIKQGFNPRLIDNKSIYSIGPEPQLRIGIYSIYADTHNKFTLYQRNYEIIYARVPFAKIVGRLNLTRFRNTLKGTVLTPKDVELMVQCAEIQGDFDALLTTNPIG